ncbi:MAG: hypothetical protein RLZZ444_188 [Pseudomonadota bacterium]|jgi:thiosulfate/3-mercaptopyruvate sulfurtransferase
MSYYISAGSLQAIIDMDDLVIYDATIIRETSAEGGTVYRDGREIYATEGHIPRAIHADLFRDFSDAAAPFPFTRPQLGKLEEVLRRDSVHDRSTVIVYDRLNSVWAARLWWVLKAAGLNDVRIVNGGLDGWIRAGGPLEFGIATPPHSPGPLTLTDKPTWFENTDGVLSLLDHNPSPLVCTLRESEFDKGHIPGSVLLPYASVVDENGQVDTARVAERASDLALSPRSRLVLYCGGGVNAAGVGVALLEAGFTDVSVYDGSLSEWKADPTRPLSAAERI